jgi:hypothetical protein
MSMGGGGGWHGGSSMMSHSMGGMGWSGRSMPMSMGGGARYASYSSHASAGWSGARTSAGGYYGYGGGYGARAQPSNGQGGGARYAAPSGAHSAPAGQWQAAPHVVSPSGGQSVAAQPRTMSAGAGGYTHLYSNAPRVQSQSVMGARATDTLGSASAPRSGGLTPNASGQVPNGMTRMYSAHSTASMSATHATAPGAIGATDARVAAATSSRSHWSGASTGFASTSHSSGSSSWHNDGHWHGDSHSHDDHFHVAIGIGFGWGWGWGCGWWPYSYYCGYPYYGYPWYYGSYLYSYPYWGPGPYYTTGYPYPAYAPVDTGGTIINSYDTGMPMYSSDPAVPSDYHQLATPQPGEPGAVKPAAPTADDTSTVYRTSKHVGTMAWSDTATSIVNTVAAATPEQRAGLAKQYLGRTTVGAWEVTVESRQDSPSGTELLCRATAPTNTGAHPTVFVRVNKTLGDIKPGTRLSVTGRLTELSVDDGTNPGGVLVLEDAEVSF